LKVYDGGNTITSVLRQLHWLPVRQRVMFKLATLVNRSLAGIVPPAYLSDECHLTSYVRLRSLRSADSGTCVPRRAHNGYGVRCFVTVGPSLWNSLPLQLRELDNSFNNFKTILNMYTCCHYNVYTSMYRNLRPGFQAVSDICALP